jgi:hypothetical protein
MYRRGDIRVNAVVQTAATNRILIRSRYLTCQDGTLKVVEVLTLQCERVGNLHRCSG